jgi:imidazolonepropionase-like amidohydrolase
VRDADDLRQALFFGVTTVLDMGAVVEPAVLFALREEARVATDMAELRSAGFFAGAPRPPGARDPRISVDIPGVASAEDAKSFVAARQAEGADYLKVGLRGVRSATTGMPNLDALTATALVDAAHAGGMLAVAHIETLDDVHTALTAGVDGLAHVWRRGGDNPAIARRIAERKVFVMPTLSGGPDGFLPEGRASLLADPRFARVLSPRIKEHLGREFSSLTAGLPPRANLDGQLAATRNVYEAGAVVLVGTDANRDNAAAFGISVHRELELLQQAGMSAAEALAAATVNTATAFRLADRGRIAPGYRADLLLVRGDPTADILATRDILRVWKAGIEAERSAGADE